MASKHLKRVVGAIFLGVDSILTRGPDRAFLLTLRQISWKLQFQDRVSNLPPRINEVITFITINWVRITIRLFHIIAPQKYTDADPYKILYVDPDQITHISGLHDKKRRGWVIDGEWDEECERFIEQPIPKAIKQYYENGKEWNETVLVEKYDDRERFERKCAKIEHLHKQITINGYQTQCEILADDPEAAWWGVNATVSPITNEITVDIGRDGEILWNMLGKHRLSIAKVSDVDMVPVQVFTRHREWQNIRNDFEDKGVLPERYRTHTDLSS